MLHSMLLSCDVKKIAKTASFMKPFAKENFNVKIMLNPYPGDVSNTEGLFKALKEIEFDFGAIRGSAV